MNLKQLLLAAILLIAFSSANAQFKFGVKAGLVHSGVTSKTDYKANVLLNERDKTTAYFSGGAVGEYWFNKSSEKRNFSLIHAELKWTRRGAALYNPSDAAQNSTIDEEVFQLDFLELPVTYGYSIGIAKNMRAILRGGAYVGWGILGKRYIDSEVSLGPSSTIGTVSPFELVTANVTQYVVFPAYKRFDTGMTFGIDLFYDRYFLSCDYQHGFVELVSYNKSGDIKNRNLVFSAGVIF